MTQRHLNLILQMNNGALRSGLIQSRQLWDKFTNHLGSSGRMLTKSMAGIYQSMSGVSAVTKLAGAAGGYMLLNDALQRNLEFEKILLDMKQTAEMTVEQAAGLRQIALDRAAPNLALPMEIAEALQSFSAAGMKVDNIKASIEEATRAAVAFRVSTKDMALLDFDLLEKMHLNPAQIKEAHNLLLYHAKAGRFEPQPMAREAPKYMNSVAHVGVTGLKGLNLTGAITQVQMKLAPATLPSEVSTLIEHGLGHITQKHYVKGLKKVKIDVKKFMPGGKFYGEGGVEGLLDLTEEMKRKGLTDRFKLSQAGFRDMYTRNFWEQMMKYSTDIRKAMAEGEKAALDDMVGRDKAETMSSNFGKIKQLAIAKEKIQLGETSTGVVGKTAQVAEWASENPKTAVAGAVVGAMAGTYALNKLRQRVMNGPANKLANGLGGDGTRVFVTNWPDCICGGTAGKMKASERMANLPGRRLAEAGASTTAGAAATGGFAGVAAAAFGTMMVGIPLAIAYGFKKWEGSAAGKASDNRRYTMELAALDRRIHSARASASIDPDFLNGLLKQRAYILAQMTTPPAPVASPVASPVATPPVNQASTVAGPVLPEPLKGLAGWKIKLAELDQAVAKAKGSNNEREAAYQDSIRKNMSKVALNAADRNQAQLGAVLADMDKRIAQAKGDSKPGAQEHAQKLQAERDELNRNMLLLLTEVRKLAERPIQLNLDSRPLVDAVNKQNGRDARRQ